MALRLTHVILSGKLANTRHYQTRGMLQFRGPEHEMTLSLEMLLHETRVFDCPIEEFDARSKRSEPPPTRVVPCLYLEWYSQNHRVVPELAVPEIEYLSRGVLHPPAPGAHLVTDARP